MGIGSRPVVSFRRAAAPCKSTSKQRKRVARRLGIKLMEVYWAKYRVGKLMKKAISEADSF